MSKIFKTPVRLPALNQDPTGHEGDIYFNHPGQAIKFYDGSSWQTVGGSITGSIILIDGGNASSSYIYNLDGGGA